MPPPVLHSVDLTDVTRIAIGKGHYLAIRSDGTFWLWGSNNSGQLGDGTTIDRSDPMPLVAAGGSVQMDVSGSRTVVVVERPLVIGP